MEFTRRGRILKKYAEGLADEAHQLTKESDSQEKASPGKVYIGYAGWLRRLIDAQLEHIEKIYLSSKERKRMIDYMAERFLGLGSSDAAYYLFKKIDSKKAKTLESIFEKSYLESINQH